MKRIGMVAGAICFALMMVNGTIAAETLKWRLSQQVIKFESIEVGDVPGHVVGVGETRGLAFFENGEIATLSGKVTIDYTNGSGPHMAYLFHTFEDGSAFVIKIQGTTTADPGGKTAPFKGELSFVQGNGRFAGIKGSGTYTGKRLTPVAAGALVYADFTAAYTVSSR